MEVDEGLFVQQNFRLGRDRYNNLSHFYADKIQVKHPSAKKLFVRRKEICPTLTEVENGGVWASVPDLVQRSIQSTITYLVPPDDLEKVCWDNVTGMYNFQISCL